MAKVTVTGASAANKRLAKYQTGLMKVTSSILRTEARSLAVEFGSATMPGPGFSANAEAFRQRVDGDVRKVYASRSDPGSVFALMKKEAPHLAGAYWAAVKSNKPRAAADIVRRAKLSSGLDPAALKGARTGKKGRVPGRDQNPVSLATEAQVRAFSRKQQQLVGFAKAGWYAAAKALGGRVRRNLVDEGGKRKTEEIFPSYIRKIAARFPDIGGASAVDSGAKVRVEIWSNVKHANAAMPPRLEAAALDRAKARVKASITAAAKALNKGGGKGKRAA